MGERNVIRCIVVQQNANGHCAKLKFNGGKKMAGTIISGVIFCIVAMIMLGIGVSQLKSKEPVGFYTGEKPPKVDQLSDVNSWNKKHGVMWIIYGWLIIITQFAVVPLYYLFLGLWQRNYLLAGTAVPFFVIHTINGIMNFAVKR